MLVSTADIDIKTLLKVYRCRDLVQLASGLPELWAMI
jgi:hypothetical protein